VVSVFILIVLTAIAAFVCDVFHRPHRSLYLYLIVRFLFPKTLKTDLGDGEIVLLWRAAETVQFCLLLMVMAIKWRMIVPRLRVFPSIRSFLFLFVVTIGISTLLPLVLEATGVRRRGFDVSLLRELFLATHYFFAIGVFLGAIMFLDSVAKIYGLFKCLVACGVVGALDVVLFYLLDISPSVREATTGVSGGFGGLAFGAPDFLGRGAVFAFFAALALGKVYGRRVYYWLAACFLLPVMVAASRPTLLSLLLALLFYLHATRAEKSKQGNHRIGLIPATVALACLFVPWGIAAFQAESKVAHWIQDATQREDFFNPDAGILTRVAIWYRAADVLEETFPIGTGGGMLPYHMAPSKGSTVAAHFGAYLPTQGTILVVKMYERTLTEVFTSVHNTYIEFIVENGLGGMVLCGWFGLLVVQGYRRLRKSPRRLLPEATWALAAILAMLFAAGINVMTDSAVKIYWFYAMLLYCVHFLSSQTFANPPAAAVEIAG
jgi:O-Antigen ligase